MKNNNTAKATDDISLEAFVEKHTDFKLLQQLKEIEELIAECKQIDEIKEKIDKIKELTVSKPTPIKVITTTKLK